MGCLSLRPISQRIRQRLGAVTDLAANAAEVVEIEPGEYGCRPAAISLPGQIDRVKGVQGRTDLAYEIKRISAGEDFHAPTLAYRLQDVHYISGHVYAGAARISLNAGIERISPRWISSHLKEGVLASSAVGSRFFGHSVTDDTCTAILGDEFGPVYYQQRDGQTKMHHLSRYLQLFDLERPTLNCAVLDKAWIFQDYAMNESKRRRLQTLRSRLTRLSGNRTGHGVFIRRRGGGVKRNLVNEIEVEECLEREGFEIIDPQTQTVDEIIRRSLGAAVVCSVEGSALAHGLLTMASHSVMVIIQPPYLFNNVWKDYTDALGIKYAFVVCEGNEDDFELNTKDLLATIDISTREI